MSLVNKLKFRINEDLDRFSELPEDIIHYILSFLPIKDVVRARILSKTWKSLSNSYEILLDLHYDHNSFALELLLDSEIEPEIDEIRDKFMDYADNHLSRVVQQQIPVLKLAVNVAVIGSEFCGVNHLMELVRKARVEELSIFVQTQDFHWYDDEVVFDEGIILYEFPYSITEVKWLRSLTLQGCKFISNNNSGMYSSLQQLYLSQVLLFSDEALSNIANCCPEIEVIEFDCCFFRIDNLKLSKFPKLKKATVKGDHSNLQSVDITETNLESFWCNSLDLDCLMNLAACSNIRELKLKQCNIGLDLLKDLTTSFPLLENAKLSSVIPYTEVLDRITVANPHLRSLKLLFDRVIQEISINCPKLSHFDYTGAGFEEVYLDCPRLRTCYYDSREVPRLILLDSPTDMQYNFYRFDVDYKLDKSWFISIRKFLEQIARYNTVYLHLDWAPPSPNMADGFVLDEFEGVQAFKPKNVHLQVQILYGGPETNQFSTAFVDGLVWITRPTTLSVGCDCYHFVKYLCEKIAEKSRDSSCCDQQLCSKYWWHNISDFEVKHKEKDMTQNLASLVEMTKQSRRGLSGRLRPVDLMPFHFKFEWHSIERQPQHVNQLN